MFSKYRIILATKGVMEVKNVAIMLKWMVLLDKANDLLKNDERVIHNNDRWSARNERITRRDRYS